MMVDQGPRVDVPSLTLDELVGKGPAVRVDGVVKLTYDDLERASDGVALELKNVNVTPGSLVGIYMERDERLIVAVLGVLKTGAAYVPLDPSYPRDRVALMLEDSKAKAVCTTSILRSGLPNDAVVLCLDECPRSVKKISVKKKSQSDLAYVIFTSGSTGRPKGVMIEHRSAVNMCRAFGRATKFEPGNVTVAVTTICFDISVLEIFVTLCHGGILEFVPTAVTKDGQRLLQLIRSLDRVDLLQATPATWRLLLDELEADDDLVQVQLTRVALCGGEPLPRDLAEGLLPRVGTLYNVYGPTETCVWSTFSHVTDPRDIHIGTPIDNTVCYVVKQIDGRFVSCGVGEPGELYIGGIGVARGYLGRDDLTAERFLKDPFRGGRMYRTGDLAAWRNDGGLQCLGRIDAQVKVRGFRVELQEVEAVVASSALVKACAVAKDQSREILVAYCVPRASTSKSDLASTSKSDLGALLDEDHKQEEEEEEDLSPRGERQDDLEEVDAWGAIYDAAYARQDAVNGDPTLNFSGYGNSFTPGALHRVPTVREWVERTVERIAVLTKPKRVLEMGCGNGMIGFRLAQLDGVGAYIGTDLSSEAVAYDRRIVNAALEGSVDALNPNVAVKMTFEAGVGAHESLAFEHLQLDTVVCNGVSMYFPGLHYTFSVIQAALDALEPGGAFFLGDVRSLRSHDHFLASIRFFQALHGDTWRGGGHDPNGQDVVALDDAPNSGISVGSLGEAVAAAKAKEKELLIDPNFFAAICGAIDDPNLPRLEGCADFRIDLKRGDIDSEFSLYRYDITFWKSPNESDEEEDDDTVDVFLEPISTLLCDEDDFDERGDVPDHAWFNKKKKKTIVELIAARLAQGPKSLGLADVVDRRLLRDSLLVEALAAAGGGTAEAMTVAELDRDIEARAAELMPRAADAETLVQLGQGLGYDVQVVWSPTTTNSSKALATLDVLFVKKPHKAPCLARISAERSPNSFSPQEAYANKGEWSGMPSRSSLSDLDVTALAEHCRTSTLPEYMVPSVFVALEDGLPLTPNGKIDRLALEKMPKTPPHPTTTSEPPRTLVEAAVARAFQDLLSVPNVGRQDSFYNLGGHSLFAARLLRRLGDEFPRGRLDLTEFHATDGQVDAIARAIEEKLQDDRSVLTPSPDQRPAIRQVSTETKIVQVVDPESLPFTQSNVAVSIPVGSTSSRFPSTRSPAVLAGRLWRPNGRVPCLIEELPYRCADGTRHLDGMSWPFLAGRGLACLRIDARGFGDSTGTNGAVEYSQTQVNDLADAVVWASKQPWCDGHVFLVGCSWGGIIALRLASLDLPELKGIVAVCATDDTFQDDMHFLGENGALKLVEAVPWATRLMAMAALPPSTSSSDTTWRDDWKTRIDAIHPPLATWWSTPNKDDPLWGFVGKTSSRKTRLPMLLVGGYNAGGYVNSIERLLDDDDNNFDVEALLGPWAHAYPHMSPFGPVGFLTELDDWIRRHRFVKDQRVVPMPQVRLFVQDMYGGGAWHQVECWKDHRPTTMRRLELTAELSSTTTRGGGCLVIPSGDDVGDAAGRWFTYGKEDELPGDQTLEDERSLCFDMEPPQAWTIVGRPRLHLGLTEPVVARLCAVSEDRSTLLTTGAGTDVIQFDFLAVQLPPKTVLRLAIHKNYFPIAFPTGTTMNDELIVSDETYLEIPVANKHLAACIASPPAQPQVARPPRSVLVRPPKRDRQITTTKNLRRLTSVDDVGSRRYADGVLYDEAATEDIKLNVHGGASVTAVFDTAIASNTVAARVVVKSHVTQDALRKEFRIITTIDAFDHNDDLVHERQWSQRVL